MLISEYFVRCFIFKDVMIKIHKETTLTAVLYGRDTMYGTLRKDNRLKVIESRVLKKIFGPKRRK
jgi:hypothetical protein